MDEAHYVNPPPISARAAMWGKKQGGRFNAKDINTILEYCINVRDLGNGVNISHILLKRYQSPKFDFQSEVSVPNARTIDLLFKTLINCRQWRKAERFLACLHKHYPRPIPVDNYAAILNKLAPVPDQIHFMKSILSYLEEHGPAPTVTLYNTFLKAHAIHSGAERAEEYLKGMLKLNQAADRQSFRILIEASLKELDLARAHYWLAEYARQGFEIPPRMMDPFVRTCIQQLKEDKGSRSRTKGGHSADTDPYSKEWMHKALHLVQFMTNQRIRPTATTFELLIEGFLLQGNLTDARKVLHQMRGSPHLYTPAPRTWTLFFEHYLAVNDHMAALKILNEMRHALSLTPFRTQSTVVPTKLYHQLFRHLLKCGKLSLAERSLYEMMIHQNRRQPSEPEATDLIWKLDRQPEAAERVYELLYSQAREPESSMSILPPGSRYVRTNRILERGPIQMANVGLMRARANSANETLHLEVWKSWSDMTTEFLERQYERLPSDQNDLRTTQKDMSVLASAFEQVARASRKLYRKPSVFKEPNQVKEQAQDTEEGDHVARGWDFGQIRRNLGPGLSLGLGLGLGGSSSGAPSLPVIGKHRLLIQRLLQQREILKPLLDRHEALSESGMAISTKTGNSDYTAENNADEIRLENLKRSFDWVQEHKIPIRIEGLNAYIESLLSHKDFDEAKSCVERFLLLSDPVPSAVSSEDEASSNKTLTTTNYPLPPLGPDVTTIQIFYNRKNRKSKISEDLMHRLLFKGGPRLVNEWTNHLEGLQARSSSPVEI
ncbi:hypothetical protein BGX21_003344 [Mortierella sp. AD011]|nr:hypothetical protein BGX20_003664 [Mortierella sp. AD010]KAF9400864.1 hypothetical protein BGX21_003344 [Mortierella sp. AD011]